MASSSDDFAVCAICLLDLIEPRQLPCGHVFCTSCLQDEIQLHIQTAKSSDFPCPSCNETVKQTEYNVNQSAWAKLFPLMSTASLPSKENRSVDFSSDKLSICLLHHNSVKNAFCKDCCMLICPKCAINDHPDCSKVLSLQNAVAVVDENLQSYLEEIKEEEENLNLVYPNLLPILRNCTESIDRDVTVARELVKRTSRELIERVKNEESRLLLELERKHKIERRKLEESLAAIDTVNMATSKIRTLQGGKKDLKFFYDAETLTQDLLKMKTEISRFQGMVKPEVKFIPDEHSLLTFNLGAIETKEMG
ncbi:tripartite motif-containing protein 75-like [Gigantopelta aegis]|uniref:tripartite motif-containing protein 75-like n=1 Tax=Gigantopelta aegis TaxID=1735272 RepID=UPI001B88BF18|nr:tripartite motif-containing protein 75-like [Gigantopelta aegis]